MQLQWNVQSLDRRFTSHEYYKYRLHLFYGTTKERIVEFNNIRQWFTDTFGPAMERDFVRWLSESEQKTWAWHVDLARNEFALYLASDKELSLWKLRWT